MGAEGKSREMRPTGLDEVVEEADWERRAKRVPEKRVSNRMMDASGWRSEKRV